MLGNHALLLSAEDPQIMAMPAPETIRTIEELLALDDDGMRHELLDGVHVVTPAPRVAHQLMLTELMRVLLEAVGHTPTLRIVLSPADIVLGPGTLVQPDLMVVAFDPGNPPSSWREIGVPLVAIEIVSPATAARDRGSKRRIYLEAGVEQYWILDVDARLVERWQPGDDRPEIIDGVMKWSLSVGGVGEIDVPKMFERMLGG